MNDTEHQNLNAMVQIGFIMIETSMHGFCLNLSIHFIKYIICHGQKICLLYVTQVGWIALFVLYRKFYGR